AQHLETAKAQGAFPQHDRGHRWWTYTTPASHGVDFPRHRPQRHGPWARAPEATHWSHRPEYLPRQDYGRRITSPQAAAKPANTFHRLLRNYRRRNGAFDWIAEIEASGLAQNARDRCRCATFQKSSQ